MAKSDQRLGEILKRISESPQIGIPVTHHPSECVNSNLDPPSHIKFNKSILDVINYYHIYCKVCHHHYYSSSKLNDINSFFQIHINSVDHIWNRGCSDWDRTKPIFEWEKWLYTGFCSICNKSGIEAFIVDTHLDISHIIEKHLRKNGHIEKYDLIKKKPFDQIMAKFDLFSNIYIGKLSSGQYFCKVCGVGIEVEALLEHHLNSIQHCKKFCQVLKKELNVNIDNRQIKLDIDELARQMKEIPAFKNDCAVINKKSRLIFCEADHSAKSELKFLSEPDIGFSPAAIEKFHSLIDEDLRQETYCALCQEYPDNMNSHLSSNSHHLRVMVYNLCSSVRPVSLIDYLYSFRSTPTQLKNRVEKYKKYQLQLRKQGLDFGITFKPEYMDINLNFEKCNGESTCEAAKEAIKIGFEERKKTIVPKNSQPTNSKKNQSEEVVIEKRKQSLQSVENPEKLKTAKKQSIDIKIKHEKLSGKDLSAVQSCIKKFLDSAVPVADNFLCLQCKYQLMPDEVEEHYNGNCHKPEVKAKSRLLTYHNRPDFIHFFEKWRYHNKSCFVCTLCGSSLIRSHCIYQHLNKNKHIDRYEQAIAGNLKPISPAVYSIDIAKKLYVCDRCDTEICKFKNLPHGLPIICIAKKIKLHEMNCTEAGTTPGLESADKRDLTVLLAELKRKLAIGEKSDKDKNGGVVDSVGENARQPGKDRETDVKDREESSTPASDKSGPKNAEATGKAGQEGPAIKKNNRKSSRKRKSANISSLQNGNKLARNLDHFFERCTSELTEFLCVICLVNDSLSVVRDHLKSESHIINENYITKKWIVNCTFCKFCKLLLLGTNDMFRQHYASTYHAEKERASTGTEIVPRSLVPKTIKVLVIRGVPKMMDRGTFVRDLRSFGLISRVREKQGCIEVQFADPRVVDEISAFEEIKLNNTQSLKLSAKVMRQEIEIGMNSIFIYILGHVDKAMVLVSSLVDAADDRLSSTAEWEKEEILCDALKRVIGCVYPRCKCYKFGSRVTGLTVGECDLDVFLDYGNAYYCDNNDPRSQARIVKKVVAALKASQQFCKITGIEHCRVPIVTCLHKSTNIHCDISFKNGLSCENTNLIKFMISLDDRVKGVVLFVKNWMKCSGLHSRPYFSSYALTMLVFFYLQQKPNPILPTVDFLKGCYEEPEKIIGEWDCGFTTNRELVPKTENSDSVIQLILGFYRFCENFNFGEYVISPLTGDALPRMVIENMVKDGLPMPYQKYESKINPKNYGSGESICIMDPFDLDHNLTKFFPRVSFEKFLYLCRISANLLSNSLKSNDFIHLHDKPLL